MSELLISVIIPVYNTEKHLATCLDSIINQTYGNLEVLLIDDGSSDGSPAICDQYAERDSRIVVIHKDNAGVSSARNLGIDKASGDYVGFVDSDDWLDLDAYEHLVDCVLKHKTDAVVFEYAVNYKDREVIHKPLGLSDGPMTGEAAIEATISPANRFAWSKLYAKELMANVRFDQQIHIGEDTLFACHALNQVRSVYYTPKPIYHHVQSESSATRCAFNKKRFSGIVAYDGLVQFCKEHHPQIIDVALSAYVSLVINVIMDLCANKDYPDSKNIIRRLVSEIRTHCFRILRSGKASLKLKVKTALCCISPLLPYALLKKNCRVG